jgi:hypothetical protein
MMGLKTQLLINTRKNVRMFVVICLFLYLSAYPIVFKATSQQLLEQEWCVEVGDSRSFIITKFYDILQPNPHKLVTLEANEDQEFVYITTEVNTKITYTITELLEISIAMGKRTINDTITLKEEPISGTIRKTVPNKAYWEQFYEIESTSELLNGTEFRIITTVTDKIIIRNASYQAILPWYSLTEIIDVTEIIHWEWMNGWVSYGYSRAWNGTNTFYEFEWKNLDNSPDGISGNIIWGGIILLGITGLIIIVNYQFKKR